MSFFSSSTILSPSSLLSFPTTTPKSPPSIQQTRTWLVTTTAHPNSSASFASALRNLPRWIWRADSSPRPLNSVRYRAVTESTMISAKRASAIIDAAASSSWPWWSVLCARAYATLSSTSAGLRPKRSAICARRAGRKVPSVSIQRALPSAPPWSTGSWQVTQRVWQSWVLPQLRGFLFFFVWEEMEGVGRER